MTYRKSLAFRRQFGQAVKRARIKKGMALAELAAAMGVCENAVRSIENGKCCAFAERASRLMGALGRDIFPVAKRRK